MLNLENCHNWDWGKSHRLKIQQNTFSDLTVQKRNIERNVLKKEWERERKTLTAFRGNKIFLKLFESYLLYILFYNYSYLIYLSDTNKRWKKIWVIVQIIWDSCKT